MSSLGTSKGILEVFKFGIYVGVPIFLMYAVANNTENLQKLMGKVNVCFAFCLSVEIQVIGNIL